MCYGGVHFCFKDLIMKTLVCLLFSSLLGFCLGAGGSVGGSSSSGVDAGSLTETESTRLLKEGSPLLLTCDYNATNLQSTWKKNGTEIMDDKHYKVFPNTSMLITSQTRADLGEYSCSFAGQEEPKFFYIVELFLHKHLAKSTTVLENDKLKLTCEVEGSPIPNVQWLKDGELLENAENSTRMVFTENAHSVPNASVLIKPILKSDFGNYMCLISQFGLQLNTTSEVRVKDIYAALWPFLGIVAEVTLLCAIIFIYERRRIKPNLDRGDVDDINDQKTAADQSKETDVRQRK